VTPDELDGRTLERLGKLETGFARLEQRVANNEARLDRMSELAERLATLAANVISLDKNVGTLDKDVNRVEGKFEQRLDVIEDLIANERKAREDIREQERKEAIAMRVERAKEDATERRWKIGLAVVIVLGLIASGIQIGTGVLG
jgi:uncharacterized protein (DUF3084 family)